MLPVISLVMESREVLPDMLAEPPARRRTRATVEYRDCLAMTWFELCDLMTEQERRFVLAYEGPSRHAEALRAAGYTVPEGSRYINGKALKILRRPFIRAALDKRHVASPRKFVATREERQGFWTSVMLGEPQICAVPDPTKPDGVNVFHVVPELRERLKASELLARSDADFIDRLKIDVTHKVDVAAALVKASKRRQDMLEQITGEVIDITPKPAGDDPFDGLDESDPFDGV